MLKLDISQDKTTTATQGKVKIGLDVHDALGKAVAGNFSVAVVDESKVKGGGDKETTILSQLLLTADLRGYIEEPAYYFNKTNDSTQNNLDILMLTQGYRRFEWKPLLAGAVPPAAYPAERLAGISGAVKTRGGKPVPGAKVTLVPGNGSFLGLDTTADSQGNFQFNNIVFRDSTQLVLQASSEKKGRDLEITIDDRYGRDVQAAKYPAEIGPDEKQNLSAYLASNKELYSQERKYGLNNNAIALKEVDIRSVRDKPKLVNSSNLNGPGNANLVITAEELEKRGSIDLIHTIEKFVVSQIDPRGMTFILDGVRVHTDVISSLPISMVASVEYLKKHSGYTTVYGPDGQNDVLVITTKGVGDTKTSPYKEAAPGMLIFSPKGYYLAREFYSPQYDNPKTNKVLANLRTTIYWQPDLVTDKTGHASFEYYNAGSPGIYRVIIEGIGADGNLGRRVYRYKVQ